MRYLGQDKEDFCMPRNNIDQFINISSLDICKFKLLYKMEKGPDALLTSPRLIGSQHNYQRVLDMESMPFTKPEIKISFFFKD